MHIHHAVRGGLLAMGVGIGIMSIITTAGAGSTGAPAASPAGRAAVAEATVVVEDSVLHPPAVAATPILIEVPAAALPVVEAEPVPEPAPEYPVIQAGPGPATPVEGAITLIDPLVIERDDVGAPSS
jgi:hypothetical protein